MLPVREENKPYSRRGSIQRRRRRVDTRQNTLNSTKNQLAGQWKQERTTVLYQNVIGQEPTNQIHRRYRLTNNSNSKIKIQQYYNNEAGNYRLPGRERQQNKIRRENKRQHKNRR